MSSEQELNKIKAAVEGFKFIITAETDSEGDVYDGCNVEVQFVGSTADLGGLLKFYADNDGQVKEAILDAATQLALAN